MRKNRRKYENAANMTPRSSEVVHRTKNLPKVSNSLVFCLSVSLYDVSPGL